MNEFADKISIIVIFFNVEKYFDICLNSIKNQTYTNFEVILVHDRSKDKSLEIAKRYVESDARFKIIEGNSKGIASARQIGLDNATGKYIAWVDSDDIVSKNFLFELHNAITSSSADMAICSYKRTRKQLTTFSSRKHNVKIMSPDEVDESMFTSNKIGGMVWDKLFKAEIAKPIKFDSHLNSAEDLYFSHFCLKNCKKVAYIKSKLYGYYQRPSSAIHKKHLLKRLNILNTLNALVKSTQGDDFNCYAVCWRACQVIPILLIYRKELSKRKMLLEVLCSYFEIAKHQLKNCKKLRWYYKLGIIYFGSVCKNMLKNAIKNAQR